MDRDSSHAFSTRPARPVRPPGHPRSDRVRRACAQAPCPDRQALLRTLYDDHATALRAYVTRLLADAHQAEDVVQETMLRAWRNADALVPERGSVGGWLMRVAHNIAVDKIRARKARPEEVEESAAVPGSLGDHSAEVVEAVFVARSLARLSPAHREVLRVVYFADRTAVQAAEELGLPVGTIKSRTHHALRRLKVCLEQEMACGEGQ
ncbi:MAG TPA: sigma-70 family RNA polymerase sigma factor [Actinoallomurus sp.]